MSILDIPREMKRGSLFARVLGRAENALSGDLVVTQTSSNTSLDPGVNESSSEGTAPTSELRLYLEARRQIKRRAWGLAQRALEEAGRGDGESPASLDLRSVRVVRRSLRRLSRWPSDVDAHLELGRAYFDLDLGDDALAEFLTAQRLAPRRYEGFALSTLEYIYRGDYAIAVSTWTRARALNPDLPVLDDVLGTLSAS